MFAKAFQTLRPSPLMIHALGGAVMAAAALAFYLGFYAPAAADVQQRSARMEQLHLLLDTGERIARDHHQLQTRIDELRRAAASTRSRMPRRTSTQEFIEQITQLADFAELEMELCSAAAPQSFKTHTQVEVACRLSGSYASVCQFLADVDQLSQISKVSALKVESTLNSDAYPIELTFQLYYRGEVHDTELKRGPS